MFIGFLIAFFVMLIVAQLLTSLAEAWNSKILVSVGLGFFYCSIGLWPAYAMFNYVFNKIVFAFIGWWAVLLLMILVFACLELILSFILIMIAEKITGKNLF